MKNKTVRNFVLALGAFILWGSIVSFLLPAEQAGAVIKTVDFATAVCLASALTAAAVRAAKKRFGTERDGSKTEKQG